MRNLFSIYRLFMRILANIHAEVSRILVKILLKFVSILHYLLYMGEDKIHIGEPGTKRIEFANKYLRVLLSKLKIIIIWLSRGNVHAQNEVQSALRRLGDELVNRRGWIDAGLIAWDRLNRNNLIFVSDIGYLDRSNNSKVVGIEVAIHPRLLSSANRDLLHWHRHFVIPMFQKRAREIALAVASTKWKSKHATQLEHFKFLEVLIFNPNWHEWYPAFF